ncbi:mannose-6-phosphate isomerase, class I [Halobacillus litoralis]|uniref:mannose-6-phosphate isomerase, class I n=1 Tax=Halobacillus litoralis TaxID=45668 RepID=UPI001CFE1EB1|nr:mannose-6-phosphate isomerase, class I [Halobacillus litoralis]
MVYNEPIFLEPNYKERIWGGTKLKEIFNYPIPSNQTGEAWCISGHSNGPSLIKNGPLKGLSLAEAWNHHRELFAHEKGEEFPLLIKILDSKKDLSVQVHPDDTYAREVEGENYGKTECWYIIDCEEDSEIIFGHHAEDAEELAFMANNGEWNNLLRRVKVKPGDFYYVPSGTIHAIGSGIQILETQQSSDITYRVYDYDRVGQDGKKRELHLEQSLEVTNTPHEDPELSSIRNHYNSLNEEQLIEEEYFSVYKWDLDGVCKDLSLNSYLLISVIEGNGEVATKEGPYKFKKGDHFIVPATVTTFDLLGNASLIVSNSNQNIEQRSHAHVEERVRSLETI